MKDWNLVATVYQDGFRRAIRALRELAWVERSPYHNVLLARANDPLAVLNAIEKKTDEEPALYDAISRLAPATHTLDFQSAEEFRTKAAVLLQQWTAQLAGRSFHVRLHRRGAHDQLSTRDIEKFLDDTVLALTAENGATARLSFTDPDAVIPIDTVNGRAGLAFWTREELARHRLLRPD